MQTSNERTIMAPKNIDADFVFCFEGKGMDNARIHYGDMVFIKKAESVEDGDIVLVEIEESLVLRRYRRGEGYHELYADDRNISPIVLRDGKRKFQIIGKAVYVWACLTRKNG